MIPLFNRYKKEILALIFLTIAVVSISTAITYKQMNDSLTREYAKKLSLLKSSLSSHLKEYFLNNKNIVLGLSSSENMANVLNEFNVSFNGVEDDYRGMFDNSLLIEKNKEFLSKINYNVPKAHKKRELAQYTPIKRSARILQSLYISSNPFGTHDKYLLYSSSANLSYDKTHNKYHGYFLEELQRYKYHDIFLINLEGDIVYSVFKEFDFGTNLKRGVYSNSSLADGYEKALASKKGVVTFSDFKPYEPSYNRPASFLTTPVFKNDKMIGVLAVQLSIADINRIMTLGGKRQEIGLGESGEAYLVGGDGYMRSDSRFTGTLNNETVDELSTTVGIIKVDTPSVRKALNQEKGFNVIQDYRGVKVFSSYAPIEVLNTKMAIVVEIDSSEAYRSVNRIATVIVLTSLALTLSFLALIGYFFLRLVLRPMAKQEKLLAETILLKKKELELNKAFLSEYKNAVDISSIVSKTDTRGVITYVNDAFCQISGYSREELIGQPHSIIRHPDTPTDVIKEIWDNISHKRVWKGVIKNLKKDGSSYYVKSAIMPVQDDNGQIKEFISIRSDITELTHKQKQLLEQSMDNVTSLPNRQKMIKNLDELKEPDNDVKLAIIQINKFKEINDFYGIQTGDLILKNVCSILKNVTNVEFSTLYKINGDEFAIMDHSDSSMERFKKTILNIVSYFDHNIVLIEKDSFNISVSVGVAYSKKENVFFNAEMTLRKAVETSKSLLIYQSSSDVEKEYRNNIEMTTKIKDAIMRDNILVYAQPIISNTGDSKNKYECLVRMKDGDKVLSPFFFLDIAIKARLYPTLTKIIIEKSFNHFRDLDSEFSINLNIEDILNETIVLFLKKKIKEYRLGHRLVLELVESEGIENFEEISAFIKDMKSYGCKIAIDDFGTGYSNFEYLMKLNADFIKIDGSLIKKIDTDMNSKVVVELIVNFAKKMNIKTIAEFVHNESVYKVVKEMGIDFTQGYYLGEPTALDSFSDLTLSEREVKP